MQVESDIGPFHNFCSFDLKRRLKGESSYDAPQTLTTGKKGEN